MASWELDAHDRLGFHAGRARSSSRNRASTSTTRDGTRAISFPMRPPPSTIPTGRREIHQLRLRPTDRHLSTRRASRPATVSSSASPTGTRARPRMAPPAAVSSTTRPSGVSAPCPVVSCGLQRNRPTRLVRPDVRPLDRRRHAGDPPLRLARSARQRHSLPRRQERHRRRHPGKLADSGGRLADGCASHRLEVADRRRQPDLRDTDGIDLLRRQRPGVAGRAAQRAARDRRQPIALPRRRSAARKTRLRPPVRHGGRNRNRGLLPHLHPGTRRWELRAGPARNPPRLCLFRD